MTESVRSGEYAPTGTSLEASPEQRVTEWNGDHRREPEGFPLSADNGDDLGVDPAELGDEDLLRELHSLHRTRLDTLRHAADTALANHLRRTAELETEYLSRYPGREVDPHRLRDGN